MIRPLRAPLASLTIASLLIVDLSPLAGAVRGGTEGFDSDKARPSEIRPDSIEPFTRVDSAAGDGAAAGTTPKVFDGASVESLSLSGTASDLRLPPMMPVERASEAPRASADVAHSPASHGEATTAPAVPEVAESVPLHKSPLGERIQDAFTRGIWKDGAVLFDRASIAGSPDAIETVRGAKRVSEGIRLNRLEEHSIEDAERVWHETAATDKPVYYLTPAGYLIPLYQDFSGYVNSGQLHLYSAVTNRALRATIAIPSNLSSLPAAETIGPLPPTPKGSAPTEAELAPRRGPFSYLYSSFVDRFWHRSSPEPRVEAVKTDARSPLERHEAELDALVSEAMVQGRQMEGAYDRFRSVVTKAGPDQNIPEALKALKSEVATYKRSREMWTRKRDDLYRKVPNPEREFFMAVLNGADSRRGRPAFSPAGMLAEHFQNTGSLLRRLYPDRFEAMKPYLVRLKVKVRDLDGSMLLDSNRMSEFFAVIDGAHRQNAVLKEALDGFNHSIAEPPLTPKKIADASKEFDRRLASYSDDRRAWIERRDGIYRYSSDNESYFISAMIDAADLGRTRRSVSSRTLLAERFPNADDLLKALYPDLIEDLRRYIPDLRDVPVTDFESTIFIDPEVTREYIEYRKTLKPEEIRPIGSLSHARFRYTVEQIPSLLDRLKGLETGTLKALEPELSALADESLSFKEKFNAAFDRLNDVIKAGSPAEEIAKGLAEVNRVTKESRPAESWSRTRNRMMEESANRGIQYFLNSIFAVLTVPESSTSLDELLAKRYGSADELLQGLYPDLIEDLRRFIPTLTSLGIAGFEHSIFMSRDRVLDFLETLRQIEIAGGTVRIEAESIAVATNIIALPTGRLPAKVMSGGYKLPYLVPGLEGARKYADPSEAGYAAFQPDKTPEDKKSAIRRRFGVFNELIESNFRALPMLDALAAKAMPKSAVRSIVSEIGNMVLSYEALTSDAGEPKEGKAARKKYEELTAGLESLWKDLSESANLPEKTASSITALAPGVSLEKVESLHTLVNYMHRRSIKYLTGGQKGSGHVTLGEHSLNFMNLQTQPLVEGGRLQSPALTAMLPNLRPFVHDIGRYDYLILNGNEVWHHSTLGKHTAETYVKFADPDDGGMLRVRFSDWETINGKRQRMQLLEAQLRRLGISYEIEADQYLTAMLDKNHGLNSMAQLAQAYPAVIQALHEDSELNKYLEDAPDMVGKMVDLYFAEGGWPTYEWNSAHFPTKYKEYMDKAQQKKRESLRRTLNEELGRLGLPAIPEDAAFGQAVIDRYFRDVVHDALIAGELKLDKDGVPQVQENRPVEAVADTVLADAGQASRLASMVTHLGLELDFKPIGMIGALRAERAVVKFGRRALVLYGLRDPETGFFGYARVQVFKAEESKDLDVDSFTEFLRQEGIKAPAIDPLSDAQASLLQEKFRAPLAVAPFLGESAAGLASSPGKGGFATATVTFHRSGESGKILVVPYTEPDDIDAIKKSAAVVATGGGLLSHAAITTRELKIPSVILPNGVWKKDSAGGDQLEFDVYVPAGEPATHSGLYLLPKLMGHSRTLKEGDLVRVNGNTGELSLFSSHAEAVHKAFAFFAKIRAGKYPALPTGSALQFVIEEAAFNPAYDGSFQADIFEHLLSSKDSVALRETQTHIRRLYDYELEKVLSAGNNDGSSDTRRLKLLARLSGLEVASAPFSPAGAAGAFPKAEATHGAGSPISGATAKASKPLILPSIVPLGAVGKDDHMLVGGKFSKLGEILRVVNEEGAFIPEAIAVTTAGYERFLEEKGLSRTMRKLAEELDFALARAKDPEEAKERAVEFSTKIRTLIKSAALNPKKGLGREIWDAMKAHGLAGDDDRLAIRSSAVQEDQQGAAFAGAADSYLHIKPADALAKIVENWASFWLPRGILYRHEQGIASTELQPSTMIQRMAKADASGVIFTRNPVNDADEIVISGAYGLGEGAVSGMVQTDRFITRKSDGEEIKLPFIGDKRIAVMPNADGSQTEIRGIERSRRSRRSLTLDQTRRLSRIAEALEQHFGYAVDIEFAIEGDRIAILQARPITSAGSGPATGE